MIQISRWTDCRILSKQRTMNMPASASWHWQAIDQTRNIAREYHLWIATDLFGWTTVERRWGRIGTKGQGTTVSFSERDEADRMTLHVRKKRENSLRRIGVSYEEMQILHTADGRRKQPVEIDAVAE